MLKQVPRLGRHRCWVRLHVLSLLTLLIVACGGPETDTLFDETGEEALTASRQIAVRVGPQVSGTSPQVMGINIHIYDPSFSNVPVYLRALGINATRMFVNYLGTNTVQSFLGSSWTRDLRGQVVTNEAQYIRAIEDLSADPEGAKHVWAAPIRWAEIRKRLTDLKVIPMMDAQRRRALSFHVQFGGVRGYKLATFDRAQPAFWQERWEMYRYYFSLARVAIQHGVTSFEVINEPSAYGITPPQVTEYLRIVGAAARRAGSELGNNNILVMGPTLVGGPLDNTPGYPADVLNGIVKQIAYSANGHTVASGYGNINAIAVHRYGGPGTRFITMCNYINGFTMTHLKKRMPLYITEFQTRSGSDWATKKTNSDTASDMSIMTAQAMGMVGRSSGMYMFGLDTAIGLNGTHWKELDDKAGVFLGSRMRAAVAYGMLARSFAGSKKLYSTYVAKPGDTTLAATTQTAGNWDIALVNDASGIGNVKLDLSALKLNAASIVNVAMVGSKARGEVKARYRVGKTGVLAFDLPPNSLARVTTPVERVASKTVTAAPTVIAQLRAGNRSSQAFGLGKRVDVVTSASTTHDNTGTMALAFTPAASAKTVPVAKLRTALLKLPVLSSAGGGILHVYGFSFHKWSEASVSWKTSSLLLPLKNGTSVSSIRKNFVAAYGNSDATLLGEIEVPSNSKGMTTFLDITPFVRNRWSGFTVLVVREYRTNKYTGTAMYPPVPDNLTNNRVSFGGRQAPVEQRPQLIIDSI